MRRDYIDPLVALLRRDLYQPKLFEPGKTHIPATAPTYGPEEIANAIEAALEFRPAAGRWAARLEKALSDFFFGEGHGTARLTNSGSSANLLAVAALMSPELGGARLKPGDEVITVAAGFPTTIAPIVQLGLVPVFVDVTPPTYNVDATQLTRAVSERTRAVMLAHTLGFPFNVEAVGGFCQRNGLYLIEDNCDAVGAAFRLRSSGYFRNTGTFGDLATLSFYPAHHMTTGEGGAVLMRMSPQDASDERLVKIVTSLRDWGRDCYCAPGRENTCGKRFAQQHGGLPFGYDHKYVYSHLGFNLKMTDMQAAIGCAQVAKLRDFIDARRRNWEFYRRELQLPGLTLADASPHAHASPFGFLITVDALTCKLSRDALVRALEAKRIGTRPLFAGNILRQPAMKNVKHVLPFGLLEETDRAMLNAFWIGVGPWLTEEMREYVVAAFHEVLK